MAKKTLEEGYIAVIKAALNSGQVRYDYRPIANAKLVYPDLARPTVHTEPLGNAKIQKVFETGVASGMFDKAFLPLIGFLTGVALAFSFISKALIFGKSSRVCGSPRRPGSS